MSAKKSISISIPELKSELVGYTRKRLSASLMLLMMNVGCLYDKAAYDEAQPIPEATIPHKNAILSAVKRLDIALVAQSETRDALLREVTDHRNAMVADSKALLACLSRVEALMVAAQDIFSLRELEALPPRAIQKPAFLADCMDFLAHVSSTDDSIAGIRRMLGCFPFQMAREKLYTDVQASLTELLCGMEEPLAAELLTAFYDNLFPEQTKGYNALFPAFISHAEALIAKNVSSLSAEDLETLFDEARELAEDLELAFESFEDLHEAYQLLILLLTFADSIENLTADDAVTKDVFYATVESLLNNEYEAFKDNLERTIDDKLSDMLEDANATWDKLGRKLSTLSPDDVDDELAALLSVRDIVDALFFEEFRVAPLTMNNSAAPSAPLAKPRAEELAAAFVERFKTALSPLPAKAQKNLRRELFLLAPHALEADELESYFETAYDTAGGFAQQAMILEKVGRVFEDFGYNPPGKDLHEHDDDCDCGHNHHNHDNDCDCGCHDHDHHGHAHHHHHHNHDHNCDCGHDHH